MTLEQVVLEAKAAMARLAEKQKEQPEESFVAWVEVPADIFAATVKAAKENPKTAETLESYRSHIAKLPGVAVTVRADQFLAIAGKAAHPEA